MKNITVKTTFTAIAALFFDEGGHWKAEHSPLDLELSESAVYSEEFWLIF